MTTESQAAALPTSSKVLCACYAVISVVALLATWSQNLQYGAGDLLSGFVPDLKANPAARSITVDLFLFGLPVLIWMLAEARKHSIKWVWAYFLAGAVTAISVTFPLFLIARELRLAGKSDPTRLAASDVVGLIIVAVLVLGIVVWVDVL